MGCPQCQSDEISPSGVCLICGYQICGRSSSKQNPKPQQEDAHGYSGMIEMDYSEGATEAPG